MPASIGVNLRVTGHCSQGGRKYMEDLFSVAYQQTEDERDLEYAFFGIYDGHGGSEAAAFAKEHLMDSIVKQRQFWSDNDEDVLKAIRNGYMLTHLNMWKELEKWPKTVTGLPSTAGTTASVAFIRRGKIYIGHVGDSAIVLGYQKDGSEDWVAKPLTLDHKPESTVEMERIQRCGGKVISKAGVPRVVWNRPRAGHKGPIKKNTPMDEIPFLAVARSLGDLWSYNTNNDEFIVSPDPDVGVLAIDPTMFRCLIFGTDGLWNMISPEGAVSLVQATERHNEAALVGATGGQPRDWLNPSKSLVDHALERWSNTRMRADNTSVVTLMLDPPGPPRATVLRSRTNAQRPVPTPPAPLAAPPDHSAEEAKPVPQNGLTIMTRYSDVERPASSPDAPEKTPLPPCATLDGRLASIGPQEDASPQTADEPDTITNYGNPAESYFMAKLLNRNRIVNTLSDVFEEIVKDKSGKDQVREPSPVLQTSVPDNEEDKKRTEEAEPESADESRVSVADVTTQPGDDVSIQINEVSSSSPTECPKARGRKKGTMKKENGAASGRVLRSHDASPPPAPRPATRQAGKKPPAPAPLPPPPIERVVILTRARPTPTPAAAATPARATRSRDVPVVAAAAQKITRSIGNITRELRGDHSGNSKRAAATGAGAAGAGPAPDCSKENCARRRRAAPHAPAPRRTRQSQEPEVHSTTGEPVCVRLEPPRALRSRNDGGDAPPVGKRARCAEPPVAVNKVPRLASPAGERAPRSLARRTSAPWAPALALRNRLRKRLAK